MKHLIDLYITYYSLAWAPSTLKSERHRLNGVVNQLNGDAEQLWASMQHLKPYTRVTMWTRTAHFWQWLIDNRYKEGTNEYERFRRQNARLFKHTYTQTPVSATYEEAAEAIKKVLSDTYRNRALQILGSGERWCESEQGSGRIIGKGNKHRTTFRPGINTENVKVHYASFRRELQKIGLKPHDLRKLFATRLVEMGAKEADLLALMGWSSISTAKAYLQPKREEELKNLVNMVQKGLS